MFNAMIIGTISFNDAEFSDTKNGGKQVKFTLQQKTSHKANKDDKYYISNNYYVTYFYSEKMEWKVKGLVKGAQVAISTNDMTIGVGKTGKPYGSITANDITVLSSSDAPTNEAKTKTKPDYNKGAEETDEESPF